MRQWGVRGAAQRNWHSDWPHDLEAASHQVGFDRIAAFETITATESVHKSGMEWRSSCSAKWRSGVTPPSQGVVMQPFEDVAMAFSSVWCPSGAAVGSFCLQDALLCITYPVTDPGPLLK
jgi:hypothetical protein